MIMNQLFHFLQMWLEKKGEQYLKFVICIISIAWLVLYYQKLDYVLFLFFCVDNFF